MSGTGSVDLGHTYRQNDLFRGGPEWHLNACVGRNGGPYDLRAYSEGYFIAARRLADGLVDDRSRIDLVIYPLVYCFRHAVELSLKHLCTVVPRAFSDRPIVSSTHKLLDNWRTLKGYLKRESAFDADAIGIVDKVIDDLVEMDPNGEAFRFPEARNGVRFLEDTSLINVRVLAEHLASVEETFDAWCMIADNMLESECGY